VPKRSLPIEHYPQEEDAGCLAACVQMALAWLEISVSQHELNRLFDLTPVGVPLSRLKRLERYKIKVTIQKNGDLPQLLQCIDEGIPPLVFIHTGQLSYWQEDTQHVILMSGYEDRDLWVNDPAFPEGPQRIQADELMLAWDEFDNIYATLTR
jgi:ABC-type bacteriocin/lantibiotic exporter with double-glycine peptidase domain